MKKIIIFLIAMIPLVASAQEKQSVVTLKNGTELKGVIKAIDPTDALTIVIAGIETKIKMADVAKVEELASNSSPVSETPQLQLKKDDKLVVTDKANYPESFDLKIGNETIKMILVRGGDMNMGFDGSGSRSMNSEPVHKVGVTSFYMSETFVTSSIVANISENSSKSDYYKTSWKDANDIVQIIADKSGLTVRLPLEAEWEYAACSHEQDKIFNKCQNPEFCSDFYEEYKDTEYRIDPKGPNKGVKKFGKQRSSSHNRQYSGIHVMRAYNNEKGKLSREGTTHNCYFRIVVKAKDVN